MERRPKGTEEKEEEMKTFFVEITGKTPLMQHKFPEEQKIKLLVGDKGKKKKACDVQKSPRDIAEDHAYKNQDGGYYIPAEFITGAFAAAAADYKQTSSKKSYKAIAGGIFKLVEPGINILNPDDSRLVNQFEVDIRIAKNRNAGKGCAVVVCRPRFDRWKVRFHLTIDDDLITPNVAQEILQDAGRRVGLGSYRISSGGHFGAFSVTIFKELTQMEADAIFS